MRILPLAALAALALIACSRQDANRDAGDSARAAANDAAAAASEAGKAAAAAASDAGDAAQNAAASASNAVSGMGDQDRGSNQTGNAASGSRGY